MRMVWPARMIMSGSARLRSSCSFNPLMAIVTNSTKLISAIAFIPLPSTVYLPEKSPTFLTILCHDHGSIYAGSVMYCPCTEIKRHRDPYRWQRSFRPSAVRRISRIFLSFNNCRFQIFRNMQFRLRRINFFRVMTLYLRMSHSANGAPMSKATTMPKVAP